VTVEEMLGEGERCQRCGRRYLLVWAADNSLWNEVVGSSAGMYYPDCFNSMCEEQGIYPVFACWREHRKLKKLEEKK